MGAPAAYVWWRFDNRRMDYLRSLYGEFCPDPGDIEARCMLSFSLLLGNHFIAAEHGTRSRADVLEVFTRSNVSGHAR